jgi:hypothetical protein
MAKAAAYRPDLTEARELFDQVVKRMEDLKSQGTKTPGLFPDGIDLISLKVEVTTFKVEFTIAGPKSKQTLSERGTSLQTERSN